METEHALALAYYLINAVLYASYVYLWKTRDITGTVFFTRDGFKLLNASWLGMKKHMWVLSLASLAFVVNVVFVSSIAFDDSAWEAADPATLRATLSLQITYFVLQWFYIPMLLSRSRSMLAWTQGLLGVCSGLQVVSAVLADSRGGVRAVPQHLSGTLDNVL